MYRAIYIIFSVLILLRNDVESASTTETMPDTTTDIPTSFTISEDEEIVTSIITSKDNITTIAPNIAEEVTTTTTPFPIDDYWMTQMGEINDDLLQIQAIVVKDEDAENTCTEGNQKSKKRYLMCAGSILNRNRILTSASCLHEAMHIRHNVRAHLAVIIAPLKSSTQMIRVTEWRVHPNHDTNPHSYTHLRHNLAILNLACRISSINYNKIQLPTEAMTHICTEGNCFIAVYRKISHTSNVIYQVPLPLTFHNRKRRRSNNYTEPQVNLDDISTDSNSNSSHDLLKIINKRSSDGSNGCSQSGAAVMINKTQTAVVAVSCDDRQSSNRWGYTDLYRNLEWIHNIINDWNITESHPMWAVKAAPYNSSKGCGNCVFNFYISVGCKEKGNCPKNGINGLNKTSAVISPIRRPLKASLNRINRMQVQTNEPSWNQGQTSSNDISRLLRSSYKQQCPYNSPQCRESLEGMNNNEPRIISFGQIPGIKNAGLLNKNFDRFDIDSMLMNAKNQSNFNRFSKYNTYHRKNEGVIDSSDKLSRIFMNKPEKVSNTLQNMYMPLNIRKNKYVQNEMSNWLRRRHAIGANTYRDI